MYGRVDEIAKIKKNIRRSAEKDLQKSGKLFFKQNGSSLKKLVEEKGVDQEESQLNEGSFK